MNEPENYSRQDLVPVKTRLPQMSNVLSIFHCQSYCLPLSSYQRLFQLRRQEWSTSPDTSVPSGEQRFTHTSECLCHCIDFLQDL